MADFSDGELSRVALGTFDRLDRLDQILTELASGIVDAGQVCVLAAEPRLRRREPTDSADSMPLFQTLFEKQRRVAVLANGEHLVAAPDDFIGLDFELERNADGLLHGLDARLINGVLALLVTTRTVPEFIAVTRLMLRFSSHSVRTREVVHHPIS